MKGSRPMTEAEIEVVARTFGGAFAARDKALFLLGCRSGFRVSELLSLQLADVIHNGKLVDRVTVQRRNMKKKVEGRTVILHPEARSALARWIEELRADPSTTSATPVFVSRKGTGRAVSRVQAWRILHESFDANEMTGKLGTHAMRKSFANRVYRNLCERRAAGEPIDPFRLTSKALGHKNINSTDVYLSFLESDVDAAILA